MPHDSVILVENVSKKYCKSLKRSMLYGISDITKNMLGLRTHSEKLRRDEFWAVRDLTFEVKKGQSLGLIGANGSGKTTMLKMINGIFWPDQGRVEVRGRVGALIAVGAGFHPLLTGRENIFINGAILGMSKREMEKKFDEIIQFADLAEFIDVPVKHYSSGMFVRLGFSVAIHCEPDILLVDEVLAVGDIRFQAKCIRKLKEAQNRGTTIIFVSHNLNSVYLLCEKSVYISHGQMECFGDTREIINEYKKNVLKESKDLDRVRGDNLRYGTEEIEIKKVQFLDGDGKEREVFKRGVPFQIRIQYEAKQRVENPEFAISIFTPDGTLVTKPTTRDHNVIISSAEGAGEIVYRIASLPFNIGRYAVTVGSWDDTGFVAYDTHERLYEFVVEDGNIGGVIHERFGLVHIPAVWEVRPHG